jgi:hypothetical protein
MNTGQSSVAQSRSSFDSSSLITLKDRKASGTATDDSLSKKQDNSALKAKNGSTSPSKDPSKMNSKENSIYGNQKITPFTAEELKINKNPMIANKEQLLHEV